MWVRCVAEDHPLQMAEPGPTEPTSGVPCSSLTSTQDGSSLLSNSSAISLETRSSMASLDGTVSGSSLVALIPSGSGPLLMPVALMPAQPGSSPDLHVDRAPSLARIPEAAAPDVPTPDDSIENEVEEATFESRGLGQAPHSGMSVSSLSDKQHGGTIAAHGTAAQLLGAVLQKSLRRVDDAPEAAGGKEHFAYQLDSTNGLASVKEGWQRRRSSVAGEHMGVAGAPVSRHALQRPCT
jgi:hypothetical protein